MSSWDRLIILIFIVGFFINFLGLPWEKRELDRMKIRLILSLFWLPTMVVILTSKKIHNR